jgi:hypothetical protein
LARRESNARGGAGYVTVRYAVVVWHMLRSHDLEDEASGELCCAAAAHRHAGRGWLGWGAGLRVRPAGRKIAGVQGVVEAVG